MTTGCTLTTPAMGRRSLLFTRPETGRGQASLWTAAAAPDHRLWTTLRGPVDPSRLPTCPLPRRRGRPPTTHQSHQSKERDDLRNSQSPSRHWRTSTAQTGGPYLSIEVGHTGLSKAAVLQIATEPYSGAGLVLVAVVVDSSGSTARSVSTRPNRGFGRPVAWCAHGAARLASRQ